MSSTFGPRTFRKPPRNRPTAKKKGLRLLSSCLKKAFLSALQHAPCITHNDVNQALPPQAGGSRKPQCKLIHPPQKDLRVYSLSESMKRGVPVNLNLRQRNSLNYLTFYLQLNIRIALFKSFWVYISLLVSAPLVARSTVSTQQLLFFTVHLLTIIQAIASG